MVTVITIRVHGIEDFVDFVNAGEVHAVEGPAIEVLHLLPVDLLIAVSVEEGESELSGGDKSSDDIVVSFDDDGGGVEEGEKSKEGDER